MTKIWMASKPVSASFGTYEHVYLVYDPDGDPTSGDEQVFRGGPSPDVSLSPKITIENWRGIQGSEDTVYDPDTGAVVADPFADRNYTELNLNGMTPEQFKQALSDWANNAGTPDSDGNIKTDVPYTVPVAINGDGDPQWIPSLNSNTTVKSALAQAGIDLNSNLPRESGVGSRMPAGKFAGAESYYTAGDSTVNVTNSVDRIIYSTGGNNTYEVDVNSFNRGRVYIREDGDSGTLDKIVLKGVAPEDVRYVRTPGGDLQIYFPWDPDGAPSVVVPNQWKDGVPAINGMWVYPPNGDAPTFIALNIPENVPLNIADMPPTWLLPVVGMQDSRGTVITGGGSGWYCPLILDLDGDGAHSVNLGWVENRSRVYFDMDNDGYAERTAWVAAGDGLLAIDKNGNGKIDGQGELFGNGSGFADGFASLKQYDSNADTKITAADAQFADLRVWVDADSDGVTDAGELKTLASLNITQINLAATALTNVLDNENKVSATSTFVMNGQSREIADHWFRIDQADTRYMGDVELDVRTLFLPTLKGFGNLKDLHVAMSEDEILLGLVQNFAAGFDTLDFGNTPVLDDQVKAILFRWAGVDGYAPTDTIHGLNAQMTGFLEAITGRPSAWLSGLPAGESVSGPVQDSQRIIFGNLLNDLKAMLVSQTLAGAELFDGLHYNIASGDLSGAPVLSAEGLAKISSDLAGLGYYDQNDYWYGLSLYLTRVKAPSEFTGDELSGIESLWAGRAGLTWQGNANNLYFVRGYNIQGAATEQSDLLMGYTGSDYIWGAGGDDYIYGGDGANFLYGENGNDHLFGGNGTDRLEGGAGNDVLSGGVGNDLLYGGSGDDTYIYGGGIDTVHEAGGNDKIVLGSQYAGSVVTLARDPGNIYDLNISIDGIKSLILYNQVASWQAATSPVERLVLGNGTEIDLTQFRDVVGTTGNDTLVGHDFALMTDDILNGDAGNDTLSGGLGNDILYGGTGDDTYIYNAGGGVDRIRDGGGTADVLSFGSGYSSSNIVLERSGEFDLSVKSAGATLVFVEGQFNGRDGLETIKFYNGATINLTTYSYTLNGTSGSDTLRGISYGGGGDKINGLGGDDYIYGGNGNDTLSGNAGNDYINGGTGNDTIIYDSGLDRFTDEGGTDVVKITDTAITAANIAIQKDNVSSKLDVFLNGILAFTLENQFSQNRGFETIKFANGTSFNLSAAQYTTTGTSSGEMLNGISYGGNPNDVINAGDGNDYVYGYLGNDTIDGGTGTDTLHGGEGNDTYKINFGEGADVIKDDKGTDTILFGAGFSKSAMTYQKGTTDSYDLEILFGGVKAVTIDDYFRSEGNVETLKFSDGTSVSLGNTVFTQTGTSGTDYLYGHNGKDKLIGQAGNDTLYGYGGSDTIQGDTGNDTLYGGLGEDTYVFSTGGGVDSVYEQGGTADAIKFGTGILSSGVRFFKTSLDLEIYYGTSDKIIVSNQYYDETYGTNQDYEIEKVVFSDGTMLNLIGPLTYAGTSGADSMFGTKAYGDTLKGFSGNDHLYGYDGNDVLVGGGGADNLYGGLGADSFVFDLAGMDGTFDQIGDFKLAEGDKLDIRDLLIGYDPVTEAITDFIQITTSGANSIVKVDRDGTDTAYSLQQIAAITNATGLTDEAALKASGNLVV
jgi:Ca2+-binding RTX toxin-like protein